MAANFVRRSVLRGYVAHEPLTRFVIGLADSLKVSAGPLVRAVDSNHIPVILSDQIAGL